VRHATRLLSEALDTGQVDAAAIVDPERHVLHSRFDAMLDDVVEIAGTARPIFRDVSPPVRLLDLDFDNGRLLILPTGLSTLVLRTESSVDAGRLLDGLGPALDTFAESTGAMVVTYTRASADVESPRSLRISREHVLSRAAKKLGLRDVEVGDAAYDETFHVKTDDAEWLRERLGSELRRLHLEHPDVLLTLRKGRLTAVRPGLAEDPRVLRALMELAALGRRAFG